MSTDVCVVNRHHAIVGYPKSTIDIPLSTIKPMRYADWKAPQSDGDILLWPEPAQLLADARANNAALSSSPAIIQNTPLPDLRRQMRNFLGVADDRQLLFVAGHQTELHHPGVWAKNVLIAAAESISVPSQSNTSKSNCFGMLMF